MLKEKIAAGEIEIVFGETAYQIGDVVKKQPTS